MTFINEPAIVEMARKYRPIAERDALDALQEGDQERYERKMKDAAFYAALLAQYDPEFWEGVAA